MIFDILTLFPEMFQGPLTTSIIGRAADKGLVGINLINIRDYSRNKHRTVDDTPYGGGGGMVMTAEPLYEAVDALRDRYSGRLGLVVLMCPQGLTFDQSMARELAGKEHVVLICGHYEGLDERVRALADLEVSIGDYVLTGGELPAMVIVDAVARLIPGVLGEPEGTEDDSFAGGLLEYPQYTKPREYRNQPVPEVLLSGHHAEIERWRREEALVRTLIRRPELLKGNLTEDDRRTLQEIARQALEMKDIKA
ncbi:MAG: tRNA (guanosine(37)-N1)-methyltransferase TrmD [Clostridia bacterium]|nr:tRNA (guanosine(37)-N1)-methyltransferase TrmD [Clostridia bacterium]